MHDNAAGIGFDFSNLQALEAYANTELADVDFGEQCYDVNFDFQANDPMIDDVARDLDRYAGIWGAHSPEPLVCVHDIPVNIDEIMVIGAKSDTIKFSYNGVTYIKFLAKQLIPQFREYTNMKITVVGKPNLNEWRGRTNAQVLVEAFEIEPIEAKPLPEISTWAF